MEQVKVLKRAWKILWSYRSLWIFGIILALTTTTASDRILQFNDNGSNGTYDGDSVELQPGENLFEALQDEFDKSAQEFEDSFTEEIPAGLTTMIITLAIAITCIFIFVFIIAKIARYTSETALIKMVDLHESTGEQHSVREGFRFGWSRKSWRLFLIDLVINLPTALVFIGLFFLAFTPMFLWIARSTTANILGLVATTGLFFLVVFLAIIVTVTLSLLKQFARRACVLLDTGVIESIRQGYNIVRNNFKDVGMMWLIMIGIDIGFSIIMIPVIFLMIVISAVTGGSAGLFVGGLARLIFDGPIPWILAIVVGAPIFFIIMMIPLGFLGGLKETYVSTAWTLTFRELRSLENLAPEIEESILDVEAGEADPKNDLPPTA